MGQSNQRKPLHIVAEAAPRLFRCGVFSALINLFALASVGLFGATLVHLLCYHLSPLGPFDLRFIIQTLRACAATPLLVGSVLFSLVVAILVLGEWSRLGSLSRRLRQRLAALRSLDTAPPLTTVDLLPRSPLRLLLFWACLWAIQAAMHSVTLLICPFGSGMAMPGMKMMPGMPGMTMTDSALPFLPTQLLVALVLALLLWLAEQRLTRLRAAINATLQRLWWALGSTIRPLLLFPASLPLWSSGVYASLYARPPPLLNGWL